MRLQGWEETFVGEMGVERKFPGRKPTRWAWGSSREQEKPKYSLCIWNKERIMDVVLYMQHKIKQISEEHAMNMDKNTQ